MHKIICAEKQQSLKSFSNVCFRKDGKRRDVNNPDGSWFSSAGKWSNPDVMIISELSQSGSWDSTAMSPILQASSCKEQFQESTDKEDNKQRESDFFTGAMATSTGLKKQVTVVVAVHSPVTQDYIFTSEGKPKTIWGCNTELQHLNVG